MISRTKQTKSFTNEESKVWMAITDVADPDMIWLLLATGGQKQIAVEDD
jgi:hypothetical protein